MPDEINPQVPRERERLNLDDPDEALYWTERFGVAEDRLQAVVREVGRSLDAVQRRLEESGLP